MISKIKESNNKRRELKGFKKGNKSLSKIKDFIDEVGFIGSVLYLSIFAVIFIAFLNVFSN